MTEPILNENTIRQESGIDTKSKVEVVKLPDGAISLQSNYTDKNGEVVRHYIRTFKNVDEVKKRVIMSDYIRTSSFNGGFTNCNNGEKYAVGEWEVCNKDEIPEGATIEDFILVGPEDAAMDRYLKTTDGSWKDSLK